VKGFKKMDETRRGFIKKGAILCAAAGLPVAFPAATSAAPKAFTMRDPKRVLILYYSQTGMTRRYARLIGCLLSELGLSVDLADMRSFGKPRAVNYDLLFVGSPVFYYDIPSNVVDCLAALPTLSGIPAAAFVSFGGPEGNQHNALCHALSLLEKRGGVAAGMAAFRSIPGYPTPNWDSANQRSGEHLPNEETYRQVRVFTDQVMDNIRQGKPIRYGSEIALREMLRMLPLVWLNKKAMGRHTVDGDACILCRTCVKVCPAAAIDPEKRRVDRDRCIACFGCLNNCPADAVVIEYRGKRLYGFPEYLKRRRITIAEPPEFQTCRFTDRSAPTDSPGGV